MAAASELADEKYVAFTTFKKDGTGVSGPVWIVDLGDGTIGFTTGSTSWKVKRLRANDSIRIQASDSRGRVRTGSTEYTGTAVVVSGAEFERVRTVTKAKYGYQFTMINAIGQLQKMVKRGTGTDAGVIISLEA